MQVDLGWANLVVNLQDPCLQAPDLPHFQTASVRIKRLQHNRPTDGDNARKSIHIQDLVPGQEITIRISDNMLCEEHGGEFVLSADSGEAVQMICSWHL
jgi:hypothetical protein